MNEQLLINPSENGCLKGDFATPAKITIAKGDGIGPEIMGATLEILAEASARLSIEEIEVGENVYLSGNTPRISQEGLNSIMRSKVK